MLNSDESIYSNFISTVAFKFEDIVVYRGIEKPNIVNCSDFLSHPEAKKMPVVDVLEKVNSGNWDISNLSVSVNTNKTEMIKALDIPHRRIKGIAVGKMDCKYGCADFVENITHHNWYLYDNMNIEVSKRFKVIRKDD